MKPTDILAQIRAKAIEGDTLALVALLISYRLTELDDRLMAIDGVLTEIRSTLQERE